MCEGINSKTTCFNIFLSGSLKPTNTFWHLLLSVPGDARLERRGFSGCLRDVSFKMTDSPAEGWKPLDWATATSRAAAYDSWEGCPLHSEDGAHFLGHGEVLPMVRIRLHFMEMSHPQPLLSPGLMFSHLQKKLLVLVKLASHLLPLPDLL